MKFKEEFDKAFSLSFQKELMEGLDDWWNNRLWLGWEKTLSFKGLLVTFRPMYHKIHVHCHDFLACTVHWDPPGPFLDKDLKRRRTIESLSRELADWLGNVQDDVDFFRSLGAVHSEITGKVKIEGEEGDFWTFWELPFKYGKLAFEESVDLHDEKPVTRLQFFGWHPALHRIFEAPAGQFTEFVGTWLRLTMKYIDRSDFVEQKPSHVEFLASLPERLRLKAVEE